MISAYRIISLVTVSVSRRIILKPNCYTRTLNNKNRLIMLTSIRSRALQSSSTSIAAQSWKLPFSPFNRTISSSTVDAKSDISNKGGLLNLQEIENVLSEVKADNVKVIPVNQHCDWMVIATGRSTWHVKNIAQALIYKTKKKQEGARRVLLPSVQGEAAGKWVVIDSGTIIVHALDEKARTYYNLDSLWTSEMSQEEPNQDLGEAFVKIRRKNNSKKPAQKTA